MYSYTATWMPRSNTDRRSDDTAASYLTHDDKSARLCKSSSISNGETHYYSINRLLHGFPSNFRLFMCAIKGLCAAFQAFFKNLRAFRAAMLVGQHVFRGGISSESCDNDEIGNVNYGLTHSITPVNSPILKNQFIYSFYLIWVLFRYMARKISTKESLIIMHYLVFIAGRDQKHRLPYTSKQGPQPWPASQIWPAEPFHPARE